MIMRLQHLLIRKNVVFSLSLSLSCLSLSLFFFYLIQEIKAVIKEDAKALKIGREETANVESEKLKPITTNTTTSSTVATVEEAESKKLQQPTVVAKERNIDLQLDLEKTDRDPAAITAGGVTGNKLHQHVPRQQPPAPQPQQQQQQHTNNEKNGS